MNNGKLFPFSRLSTNALKILAAVSMLIDHAGLMFFPQADWMRILGRLAYPIFAFMIAEGCRHTSHKGRYLLQIGGLGVLCQVVYYLAERSLYMSILITFSLSIVVAYALMAFQKAIYREKPDTLERLLTGLIFFVSVVVVWKMNQELEIDYGFWGSMVPVMALIAHPEGRDTPVWRLGWFTLGLLCLSWKLGGLQIWSLLALVPLALYSGERGKWKMKYFFYLFYPIHLVVLEGILVLTKLLK